MSLFTVFQVADADWNRDSVQNTEGQPHALNRRIGYESFFDAVFELAWVSGQQHDATDLGAVITRTVLRWMSCMFRSELDSAGKAGWCSEDHIFCDTAWRPSHNLQYPLSTDIDKAMTENRQHNRDESEDSEDSEDGEDGEPGSSSGVYVPETFEPEHPVECESDLPRTPRGAPSDLVRHSASTSITDGSNCLTEVR